MKNSMSTSRRWALAALWLAAALVLGGCRGLQAYDLPFPGKVVDPDDGYQVSAEFADVVDVVPRTLVLMNDVPIGQVDEVHRVGWHASVTMTVRHDIVLPADTEAEVRKTSLLGEKYIALLPPESGSAGGQLADGAVIPLQRTGRNPDVEEVLGSLSFLLARGGVGQLKTISTELNAMMTGRSKDIRSVLDRLDAAVGTLDASKSQIIMAMEQVDRLASTLNKEDRAIKGALDSFGPALKVLHKQHNDLVDMLQSLDKLGTVATRVINNSGDNIVEAFHLLRPTLTQLANAGDALPQGLMMLASFPFPKQSADLARGNYSNALFHLELDLNQVVQGLLTGESTGLPELLQICITYSKDCEKAQPLAVALCNLTHLEMACSVVGKQSAAVSAPAAKASGVTPNTAKSPLTTVDKLTDPLVGGNKSSPGIVPNLSDLLSPLLGGAR